MQVVVTNGQFVRLFFFFFLAPIARSSLQQNTQTSCRHVAVQTEVILIRQVTSLPFHLPTAGSHYVSFSRGHSGKCLGTKRRCQESSSDSHPAQWNTGCLCWGLVSGVMICSEQPAAGFSAGADRCGGVCASERREPDPEPLVVTSQQACPRRDTEPWISVLLLF